MKTLIFTGLVLGAATYLVATHNGSLHSWLKQTEPHAQQMVETSKPVVDAVKTQTSPLVDSLKRQVADLQRRIDTLEREKQEKATTAATNTQEAFVAEGVAAPVNEPPVEAIADPKSSQDESASVYMPPQERSEALLALIRRMELKAASQ